MALLEGFLDESGVYCFTNITLESFKSFLSHKSHSLSPIVNNVILANMNIICQSQNKSVSTSYIDVWHARLGHANLRAIYIIFQLCNIIVRTKILNEFLVHVVLAYHISCMLFCTMLNMPNYLSLFTLIYRDQHSDHQVVVIAITFILWIHILDILCFICLNKKSDAHLASLCFLANYILGS